MLMITSVSKEAQTKASYTTLDMHGTHSRIYAYNYKIYLQERNNDIIYMILNCSLHIVGHNAC